ncbi:MAG: hypothetical protein JNM76_03125 [Betaproteobacteria bacterium]|nr:hypothetical protein [Betaproteobacteria bacterium]
MELRDLPRVSDWLSQFDLPDVYLAEHMLRRIRYVGFEEFEEWLQESVSTLLKDILEMDGRVAVAIFPVTKPFINVHNEDKAFKSANDSAGRLAHSLKNLERSLPSYVELTPRVESMRAQKVRHIIFVDDFVGTGDRFIKSWRTMVPASIKSWCSRGWCKVWFLTFAGHASGLKRIGRNVRTLSLQQIRVRVLIEKSFFEENAALMAVLTRYRAPFGNSRQVMGYGGLACPVIFQHGCPNNVPLILWAQPPRRKGGKWRPLFPDRHVPAELYPLFSEDFGKQAVPEELWMAGHFQLALNVLERIAHYEDSHQFLLTLSLLAKGHRVEKVRNTMVLATDEFNLLLNELRDGGLIDEGHKVTRFGHDLIVRATKPKRRSVVIVGETNFYPSSFLGFQREA